jgi:hypothetical protein
MKLRSALFVGRSFFCLPLLLAAYLLLPFQPRLADQLLVELHIKLVQRPGFR